MASQDATPSRTRLHIVFVPGFGGFDALGQLEYYAGITPIFRSSPAANGVLHYFDNFPTAAVVTRAARLRSYLGKRIARGEISTGDEVILVGHSTGGLDIRWLLWDLHRRRNEFIAVDGGARMKLAGILDCVRRVVFLSVPHWGTNIADWVRAHGFGRQAVVAQLRAAVAGSQVPVLDQVEGWSTAAAAHLAGGGLLRAVQDSLREADEHQGKPGPERTAEAHEAASELALYLRHMASDFRAIDDLASGRPAAAPVSPAHLGLPARRQEIQMWKDRQIETLSYVTARQAPVSIRSGPARAALGAYQAVDLPRDFQGRCAVRGHRYRLSHLLPRVCRRPIRAAPRERRGGSAGQGG